MIERLHPEENRFDLNSEDLTSERLNLDSLREEIRTIQEQELAGNLKTAHLTPDGFDPDELTKEDLIIWHKFKSGTLNLEEFRNYQQHLKEYGSSAILAGMIANKMMLEEEIKEMKEKKDNNT
jgi:hypothetical protein